MAARNRRFGGIGEHPLASKPVPMQYDELLAEIAHCDQYLAAPPTTAKPGDRTAVALRHARLVDARDAWDAHVAGDAGDDPRPADAATEAA